ncbi:MAG TPA: PEP-CTERM sorting domain-containing protein [Edaphobacter sp.]
MKIPTLKSWFLAIFLVAALFSTTAKLASADTYKMFALANDAGTSFYSMDDSGNVALATGFCPPGPPNVPCYDTYHYGVPTALGTFVVPTFTDDQGTPCTPAVPPGGHVLGGVCNNGREVFTGTLSGSQVFPGLYSGSFPDINTIVPSHFGGDGLYMNSNGDIVVDDIFSENWYFFQDTSVPEPGSILLFGTGALAAIGAIRRSSRAVTG